MDNASSENEGLDEEDTEVVYYLHVKEDGTIDYSVQELHIYSQARNLHCAEEAGCCDPSSLDITPEDLAASETVTVVWSLSDSEHKE